nr:sulfatase-like hydrolase/transferase [Nitrosomonas eutropha]
MDFDEFMDIRTFDRMQRYGPYISDAAVTAKIMDVLTKAREPVFIFAITMENHGPLHLERVAPSDINELYSVPPPPGCDDLTIYLRHIRNADRMVADLRRGLEQCERPASLCWYGDHVPIMPVVYKIFGKPGRDVEYVCWSNQHKMQSRHHNLDANDLAVHWLRAIDLIKSDHH